MAVLSEGVAIPEPSESIHATGVAAMRLLGVTANTAIGAAKFARGLVPASGVDIFRAAAGGHTFSNATVVANSQNLPEQWPGVALVLKNDASVLTTILYFPYQRDYFWTVTSSGFSGTPPQPTFPAWQKVGGISTPGTVSDLGQTHAVRRAIFRRRRGGVIGTGGLPVIALRWDHGLNNFKDLVLPHLQRLGLPGSMAMNSAANRWALSESDQVTPAMLDGYATGSGIEVWNHSQTHGPAEDLTELTREIVNGLTELQAQIPSVPVEGFVIPGVPSGNYAGFSAGEDISRWDTMAGRLILGHHAVSSSHMAGTDGPLTGDQPIIGRQLGIDSMTAASVIAAIDRGIAEGAGQTIFLHPSQLDLTGKITAAHYVQVLEHIASRRAVGDVMVLSMGGLSIADATRDYRHDLVTDPEFSGGLAAWGSPAGWSIGSEGYATTGTSTNSLTQTVSLSGREWVQGSPRELVVRVRSRQALVVTAELALGSTVRAFTVPAGTEGWTDVRLQGIVPLDAEAVEVRVRRASGDYLHVQSVRLLAV